MLIEEPHHVIAIGASAGGIEEINTFFDHTPLDGVCYIIVQHLSAHLKSNLVELTSRHSKLAVVEAENEMPIKKNYVYIIPNDKFMVIRDAKFYLTERVNAPVPHYTINYFLHSLAADSGKKSIAVILSGLGADGADGAKAIKKAGGMVMARNPETTQFNGMPSNVIATGVVDFVSLPELMPGIIEEYVKHDGELQLDELSEKHMSEMLTLIKNQLPLDFSDYKRSTILRRIKRRAASNNFTNLEQYLEFLKTTPVEVETLAKDFLISVTAFFRDKDAFDFLKANVFPQILNSLQPGEELKIWLPGCATGEEAYSIAMVISELLTGKFKDTVVKIFATDIDTAALAHARTGFYGADTVSSVSPERLATNFIEEPDGYRVIPDIRKMVIFSKHDLVKNPPYCNMHFISCRNLLIYMTPVLQKRIYSMFLFGLKTNGYLFLGSSESPLSILADLQIVNGNFKIYKNLKTKRDVSFEVFSMPEKDELLPVRTLTQPQRNSVGKINLINEQVSSVLASETGCLAICIDANNHVVKSYGDTTRFLYQKVFNTNLVEVLPRPLAMAFNMASREALKTKQKATIKGIQLPQGSNTLSLSLSVTPLPQNPEEKRLQIVTLIEDQAASTDNEGLSTIDEHLYLNQYTLSLEEEITELKAQLHDSREKLNATNENMQSFNEELLSANEEMQSTNEEMQSINEELETINTDYQLKNKSLIALNDDLNNYFRSNLNGQVIVDKELHIVSFSPAAVSQINLLHSDIGRPLNHISTNIKLETIIQDIREILQGKGSVITKEIQTNDGKWYQVMTMPYLRQAGQTIDGAIITFNNITVLKQVQAELNKKNDSLNRINADLDNFIHVASHDLLGPLGNIQMNIDLMTQIGCTDEAFPIHFEMLHSSIKKFRTLIADMATIAKVESDLMHMEWIDLEEIIDNILWSLDHKIKKEDVIIEKSFEVKHVRFSKKNLRSILYNLISNAIKFRGATSPFIKISTAKNEDDIILSVEDNGIGMERVDKIFSLYGRIQQHVEGSGVGLYLAKKMVDASGGNIVVESELGTGTKFSIFLKNN